MTRNNGAGAAFVKLPPKAGKRLAAFLVFFSLFLHSAAAFPDENSLAEQIRSNFRVGRWEAGVKALAEFRKKYKDSPLAPELDYLQAQSCRNSFDAQKLYAEFAERYPGHNLVPAALIESAKLYLLMGDSSSAIREARRVRDQYSSSPSDDAACLVLGEANARMGRHSDAANEFAALLALHPASGLKAKALLGLADAKSQMNEPDQARDLYNKVIDLQASDVDLSRVYYALGQIAERKGERFYAVRLYKAVAEKMPRSFYASAAAERLKELGDKEDLTAGRGETRPPMGPPDEYSVLVGVFEPSAVDAETAPFTKSGFHLVMRKNAEGRTEALIGSFTTRIQAEFFAEELQKKFNRQMSVVKIK